MEYTAKRLHTRKNMSTNVYTVVFRGRHSWRNILWKVKESSQFHFIWSLCEGGSCQSCNRKDCPEKCGERRKTNKKGGGCMVVPSWWPCASNRGSSVPVWTSGNAWEAGLKTFRQQVGVHGRENRKIPSLWSGWRKVMMPHVMFRSDWKTYGCNILGSEWESYGWTSLQYGCYMDHVLWEGLYADRVRTNWCFGTKDQSW